MEHVRSVEERNEGLMISLSAQHSPLEITALNNHLFSAFETMNATLGNGVLSISTHIRIYVDHESVGSVSIGLALDSKQSLETTATMNFSMQPQHESRGFHVRAARVVIREFERCGFRRVRVPIDSANVLEEIVGSTSLIRICDDSSEYELRPVTFTTSRAECLQTPTKNSAAVAEVKMQALSTMKRSAIQLPAFLVGDSTRPWREDILLPENRHAFVLHGFLSVTECSHIIDAAEAAGLVSVLEEGYPAFMRVVDKVSMFSEEASEDLFCRALHFLPQASENWIAAGLNPTFRVCRYKNGGYYLPHKDGGFVGSNDYRSMFTMMVYLNDGYIGGDLCFYDRRQRPYSQGDPKLVVHRFSPTAGACLIFESDIIHDGGLVEEGLKYILRSEVMFARCPH